MWNIWEENANLVQDCYGGHVDWEERFYECPECGEPIYECDWSPRELVEVVCPICGFCYEDELFIIKKKTGYNQKRNK